MPELTREEFLARCGTAWDAGLIDQKTLPLLDAWTDIVMRFEGGQLHYFLERLQAESERTRQFHGSKVLASDRDGYALVQFAAILNHPCQTCATDTSACWTRAAFCPHRPKSGEACVVWEGKREEAASG